MNVADGEVAFLCIADVVGPDVGIVEIECLLGSKAVDFGRISLDVYTFSFLRVEDDKR